MKAPNPIPIVSKQMKRSSSTPRGDRHDTAIGSQAKTHNEDRSVVF
jgi:hypothetical protein